jgi:hypothetical protein
MENFGAIVAILNAGTLKMLPKRSNNKTFITRGCEKNVIRMDYCQFIGAIIHDPHEENAHM